MRRIPRFPGNYADADQARRRRLPAKWLAAMLITAAAALLAPGVTYVTAGRSSTASMRINVSFSILASALYMLLWLFS